MLVCSFYSLMELIAVLPSRNVPYSVRALLVAVIICLLTVVSPPVLHADDTVVFIHDTHLHGQLANPGLFTSRNDPGNRPDTTIQKYFGLIEQIRARRGDTYTRTLGGGDDPLKWLLGWEYKGDHMIDAFNAGGLDYNSFGNHEFDAGPANMRRLVDRSDFQWVTANVVQHNDPDSDIFTQDLGTKKYVIEEINDVRVGFTGYAHDTAPDITIMGHRVGLLQQVDVLDPVAALPPVISDMQDSGAEFVVVMGHASPPLHRRVARSVNGIDLIVGDHAGSESAACQKISDTSPDCTPNFINDTVLFFVEDDLESLGEAWFQVQSGTISDSRFIRHNLSENRDAESGDTITVSPAVQSVFDTYVPPYRKKFEDTVGRTQVAFDARGTTMSTGESAVGDFLADATRAEFNGDFSLHPPIPAAITGGRQFPAGPLRRLTLYETFAVGQIADADNPFFPPVDLLVKMEMTGDSIARLMEFAIGFAPPSSGNNFFFPSTSGMWYAYNTNRPVGNQVSHIYINGKPLDRSDTYEMVTTAFLARPKAVAIEAGLNPSVFPPAVLDTVAVAKVLNSRLISLEEVLVDKIKRESPIAPSVAGRVSVVTDIRPSNAGGTVTLTNADLGRGAPEAAPPFELQLSTSGGIPGGSDTVSVFALGPTHPVVSGIAAPDTNFQVAVNVTPDSAVDPDSVTLTLDVNGADTAGFSSFQPAVYEPDTGWVRIDPGRVVGRDGARVTFHPPHFSSFAVVSSSGTRSGDGGGGDDTCLVERMHLPAAVESPLRSARDRVLKTTIGRWLTATYYRLSRRVP